MTEMKCPSEEKYVSKAGACCDRCPAGHYVQDDCSGTTKTRCVECGRGFYTATANHLERCHKCTLCSVSNKQRTERECTAHEDTVCRCMEGFYCSSALCELCQPLTRCPPGSGVKVQASPTNDTVCAPCGTGTYSDVSDLHSTCQTHTSCESLGRLLRTPGTSTRDAICGGFKSHCPWVLPAGLWSGFLLTLLLVLGLICWRTKRKSRRAARSNVPVTLLEVGPATEPPLPAAEHNGHCQDSCEHETDKFPLFDPDERAVSISTDDSVGSSLPSKPPKASVSSTDSNHPTANFLRTYSEPQEDEWCGT